MTNPKMLIFDIDGVLTDGKVYIDTNGNAQKCYSLKDMDALKQLKEVGYKLGCISGERAPLEQVLQNFGLDYMKTGCKDKVAALEEIVNDSRVSMKEVAYIGDGKYDIDVLRVVGMAICPADATREVKSVSDIVLASKGGEGCIAEIYSLFADKASVVELPRNIKLVDGENVSEKVLEEIKEHERLIQTVKESNSYINSIAEAIQLLEYCYDTGHRVYICGNGGSAADAQHIAGELVGRFCLERNSLPAEALSTDTSVLTSLANDYDYEVVFARQIEGKGREGDVLIGISTSGKSQNVLRAFQVAKKNGMRTILVTGKIEYSLPVLEWTDCCLSVPAVSTPRIQEIHMLTYHIICKMVEEHAAMQ